MSNLNTVSTLQDLVDHAEGLSRRHEADSLDLTTPLVIGGETFTNVQEALEKLSEMALPPSIPDATGSVKGVIRLSGDLGGTASEPSVTGIRGMGVSADLPSEGNVLTWSDNAWKPLAPTGTIPNASTSIFGKVRLSDGVTTAGDIGGNAGNLSIIKLQDYPLNLAEDGNPVYENQFIKWDGYNWINSYLPKADGYNFGTVRLAGDLELASSSGQLKVTGLQTYPVYLPCEPYNGDLLTWVSPDGYWTSKPVAQATATDFGAVKLAADLGGTASEPEVVGWRYKQLGSEFSNPQRYDIPIYNSSISFASSPTFGFDLPEEEEKWTLINLQDIIGDITFTPSGDLTGSNSEQTVVGLYGVEIDSSAAEPSYGDVLMYQEVVVPAFDIDPTGPGKWVPTQLTPSQFFSPNGDLSGTNFSQNVVGWRGKDLSEAFSTPTNGDIPIYNSFTSSWNLDNLYSILETLSNDSIYEPGNPETKEYFQNAIRNRYFKYQNSVVSVNSDRDTFKEYSVKDNSSILIKGKIIGRVIQNNEPEVFIPLATSASSADDGTVDLTPSDPGHGPLGFDLESTVYPGYTVIYDIEASYVKNDGYIQSMYTTSDNVYSTFFDSGVSNNIVACISEFPSGIGSAFYPPVIQFVDNSTIQIVSGYAATATVNWTIDLEVRENGI